MMAKSNNQKGKILYLARLLNGTGEGQVATMQDILAYLQENGISAERKSIYDDMDVLRSFGMDIRYRRGRPGGYYVEKGQAAFVTVPDPAIQRLKTEPEEAKVADPVSRSDKEQVRAAEDRESRETEVFSTYWTGTSVQEPEESRAVKLLILDQGGKKEVETLFGSTVKIRDRQDGTWTASVSVDDSRHFYGWLTAVGMSVRLTKPRKMIQNYREYLKYLSREYKQVP